MDTLLIGCLIPFTWFEINVRTNHGSSKFDEINGERIHINKMKRLALVRPHTIGNYEDEKSCVS